MLEEKHENLNQIWGILSIATFSHVLVPFEQYGQLKKTFVYFMEKLNEIICKYLKTKISLRDLNTSNI